VAHACNPSHSGAEIRRIGVRSQPGQIVHQTLSQKNPSQKRAGGGAQGGGTEFKLQHHTHKKEFSFLFEKRVSLCCSGWS
jgi:hypothetical protein